MIPTAIKDNTLERLISLWLTGPIGGICFRRFNGWRWA
jgi:hypothetical protein